MLKRRAEYVSRKKPREPVPVSRRGELSKDAYVDNRRRARKVSTLSGVFCVVVFIIAVFVFLWNYWLDDVFTSPETMTIPELTGADLKMCLSIPLIPITTTSFPATKPVIL